ncbi:MAG: L-lactate permease [Terriglobia bacterium]
MRLWQQPLNPLHHLALSALAAFAPLVLLLVLMGVLRKSSYVSAAWGLVASLFIAVAVWGMPFKIAVVSAAFGAVYALWAIMWIVFTALWLYNLCVDTGKFELLRRWMGQHASGDPRIQAILVGFCFGALLEGVAGFGTPVALGAFILVGLGFAAVDAVTVTLISNMAPAAYGAIGIPIVALAAVTGLPQQKLSEMSGRQMPFIAIIIPFYLVWIVAGRRGIKGAWLAAAVGGGSFGASLFIISNTWGPYACDIIASMVSIAAITLLLKVWKPSDECPSKKMKFFTPAPTSKLTWQQSVDAWAPWAILAAIMILWSYFKLFATGRIKVAVPALNNAVFITLYHKPYAAIYTFDPLAAGTAALLAVLITALILRVSPGVIARSGLRTLKQVIFPTLTVCLIVALAYLYNYSGMAYTLGAALATLGAVFPFFSSYLGWIACFMSGSDTASNFLFGNLQVAAAHQIGINPVLLASTNCVGAAAGKTISPQSIAVGVTTVGLVGREGEVLRTTIWHSILLAAIVGLMALAQAYWLKWMVP